MPVAAFVASYKGGLLPLYLEHGAGGVNIHWTTPVADLDTKAILPLLFDGLRIPEEQFRKLAALAVAEILEDAKTSPRKQQAVIDCMDDLMLQLSYALRTLDAEVILLAVRVLHHLLSVSKEVGAEVTLHPTKILPTFSLLVHAAHNTGDAMDFKQFKDVGAAVTEVIHELEAAGTKKFHQKVKLAIPTWDGIGR